MSAAALGIAKQALDTIKTRKIPISIGMLGQSVTHGNVPISDKDAYPQVFASQRLPGYTAPLPGARSMSGGALFKLIDDLWDHGYETSIVNGAKGSMSLVTQGVGQVAFWQPQNNGFFKRRFPSGNPDRGYFGKVIIPFGTKVFVCTGGRDISAMGDGPFFSPAATSLALDFIQFDPVNTGTTSGAGAIVSITGGSNILTVSSKTLGIITAGQYLFGNGALSGLYILPFGTGGTTGTGDAGTYALSGNASASLTGASISMGPDFFTPTVIGSTVVDGAFTWTLVSTSASAFGSSGGTVLTEGHAGYGFDPLGILVSLHDQMQVLPPSFRKFIYIDGNQSDLSQTAVSRQNAVVSATNYFLNRGYEVLIGNQVYSPNSGSLTSHQTQNTANFAAFNFLKTTSLGSRVFWGADLFTALGGTNNITLLQNDLIHTNSPGSLVQGAAYAESFKLILPKVS